ncbi:MAG: thiosulfate oxidation carrier complex protein SoxZ [Gemmatimonadales bacterium]|nr:thiosulfate oxidation carrier complex protein SoxZ [Gemmatimonadales bacterium]
MRGDVGDARIRVPQRIQQGQQITVHAIVQHPMDTGFFRTADGQPIPAWFVKEVVVTYAGRQVARFTWTSGVSRDPVVSFGLVADREGPLTIRWTDTRGAAFEQSVPIAFAAT